MAPNDSLVATGSQDKTVKIWDALDLSLKGTLKGHKRGVWDCRFSSHDRIIATAAADKTVKLWSIANFSCVRTFQGHTSGVLRVRFLSAGLQLLSCDAEGILRLWSVRSNECVFSIAAHDDRVWALDLTDDGTLVSGGADSRIKVFRDTTAEMEEEGRKIEERDILMEQKLANHLRFGEHNEALDIALSMDKPRQVLKVLMTLLEEGAEGGGGNDSLATLRAHIKGWKMSRVTQVLRYCRDWNTRARNSHVAMSTLKAIVTTIPADRLARVEGLPEILSGIAPYAERHFQRIDKLHASSYFIDFTLRSMGNLEVEADGEYARWEAGCKLVTAPKKIDGSVQIGGQTKVGYNEKGGSDSDSEDFISIGDSNSDSDSSSGSASDSDDSE